MERGQLRSGGRFIARNRPFYSSEQELLAQHTRLIQDDPAVSHREVYIVGGVGNLIQTTVRFPINSPRIQPALFEVFTDLFQQISSPEDFFEVVITFNAVLYSSETNTYSLFYGHDYREDNIGGTARDIALEQSFVIRNLAEVDRIPTRINVPALLNVHRNAFANSNVRIHSIVNVIYLIYRYVNSSRRSRRARRSDQRR